MNSPVPTLFQARENRLGALDALARAHWLGGIIHSQGTLEPRLRSLVALRAALFEGTLPAIEAYLWPPPAIAAPLADAISALGLPRYCAGQRELTDTVIMSLLFHLDFIVDFEDRGASAGEARAMAIEAFIDDWRTRCGEMDELVDVFGMLPENGKNTNWDRLRGLLRSSGWRDVVRIRRLIEALPELARVIHCLGRARLTEDDDPSLQRAIEVMASATAQRPTRCSVRIPDMPGETRGVRRSDRIARMLPAEAMLLGHPRLRLVWHARRAERTLLCYEDDDRMNEVRFQPAPVMRPAPGFKPGKRAEMGPMLVCVDTSGSMQGGAEAVAKAVVLEAMRTAGAQRRACHVFAFGGPDEVVEIELGIDTSGIGRLAAFLGQSFRGGTDICGPLDKALAKLESQTWRYADLLVASDGEFGATPAMAARLDEAKRELGVRVQGVLIGDRETLGFLEIADHILPVRDWRRFGNSDDRATESPIHSHRLTAMYFPGALRNPENLDATVSPAEAADAVRRGRRPS